MNASRAQSDRFVLYHTVQQTIYSEDALHALILKYLTAYNCLRHTYQNIPLVYMHVPVCVAKTMFLSVN